MDEQAPQALPRLHWLPACESKLAEPAVMCGIKAHMNQQA